MKIVYNPKKGAPITKYIYFGSQIEPHYPDGMEVEGKRQSGLKQYDDDLADAICSVFTFLEELTVDQAKKLIDRPEVESLKCEEAGCEFTTTYAVALSGHKRKHNKEKAVFDENVIPVAKSHVVAKAVTPVPEDEELKAGRDKDGVEWYGHGATIEKPRVGNGFSTIPNVGQGHFVG